MGRKRKRRTGFQACMRSKLKGKRGRGAQRRFGAAARACSLRPRRKRKLGKSGWRRLLSGTF